MMTRGRECPFGPAMEPTDAAHGAAAARSSSNKLESDMATGVSGASRVGGSDAASRMKRRRDGKYTLEEVRKHKVKDDAWIVVHGKVYDITEHILNHPGWDSAAISTVLSILAHIGMDCTEEFVDIHRPYPIAWNQLKAYYIGELVESNQQEL